MPAKKKTAKKKPVAKKKTAKKKAAKKPTPKKKPSKPAPRKKVARKKTSKNNDDSVNKPEIIEAEVEEVKEAPDASPEPPRPAEAAGYPEDDGPKDETSNQAPENGSRKEDLKTHVADMSKKAAEVTGEVFSSSYEKVKEYDPKTSIHLLDRWLNFEREVCSPEMFDNIAAWCAKNGHTGIVIAQILTAVFFILQAIQTSSFGLILHGAGTVLLLVILQYAGDKFLNAGQRFIASTPSRLNSPAFLDCTSLLLDISGLLLFVTAIANDGLVSVNALIAFAIWMLLEAISFTAVHPGLVNVSIEDDVTAGEEAIGILSFFAKSALKVVPIAYGVGAIVGAFALAGGSVSLLFGNPPIAGKKAISLIVVFAALPLASYIFFMVYHLLIDILQSILSVPRKLDDLK